MDVEVHLFEVDGGWSVAVGGDTRRFADRASAFRAARDALREHAPSVLVAGGLTAGPAGPGGPADRPPPADPPTPERVPGAAGDSMWARHAGPPALGRCLLLGPGTATPPPWLGCPRVRVDGPTLADPGFLEDVRRRYLGRERAVYEIAEHLTEPGPSSSGAEVWSVPVDHDFVAEDAWDLLVRNAVDGRDGTARRPLLARALDAGARAGTVADVVTPDGGDAWLDGGPLRLWTADEIGALGAAVVPVEAVESGALAATTVQPVTADLAPDQLEAVAGPGIRARIIAPAGSGKTRVLTERARHLLRSGVPAEALVLVAFNKRAQLEMVERTADLPGLQVRTLNALGLAVLNGTDGFARTGRTVRTIDEPQVRDLLGELVTFPRKVNTDPAASWIDALSAVRLGLQNPEEVEAEFAGDVDDFAGVFPRYRRELQARGVVDFDEQIYGAVEALLREPDLRRRAQHRARLLLVDEFQDLTPAHMLLLRLLAGPGLGIFGVGDDDQTIYGYSGATPRWLVSFDHYVPGAEHHDLSVNYRCPAPVVDAARHLLSRNQFRVAKEIHPGPGASAEPIDVVRHEIPAVATAEAVARLLEAGSRPEDVAVLTRVNTLLAPIQAALRSRGIPARNRDGTRFVARAGVDAALSWFRLAVAPGRLSGSDLMRAARRPTRAIAPRIIEWIGEQQDVDSLERLAGRISDERSRVKVQAFARDVHQARDLARTAPSAAILEFVRTETGLDRSMQQLDAAHRGRNSAAHSDDLRALVALGHLHPDAATFTDWLDESLRPDGSDGGVTLATVHRVKGLEWPHVIVHDATNGVFPHRLSTDIEEERRVFHVAITRAQRSLHLVAEASDPTMFLDELGPPARLPEQSATPPGGGGRAPAGERRRGEAPVPASVGLTFSWGGYPCTVSSVTAEGVVATIGSSTVTIPFGSDVTVAGRRTRLGPPARTSPSRGAGGRSAPQPTDADPEVVAALTSWRLERSRRDGVPAYVVCHNSTLQAIASALPDTEAALLAVPGIGPKRFEEYGDEILAVLDQTRG